MTKWYLILKCYPISQQFNDSYMVFPNNKDFLVLLAETGKHGEPAIDIVFSEPHFKAVNYHSSTYHYLSHGHFQKAIEIIKTTLNAYKDGVKTSRTPRAETIYNNRLFEETIKCGMVIKKIIKESIRISESEKSE